ncbi:MAG: DUF3299 domain-containing protein [Bacteroidota bacterium]
MLKQFFTICIALVSSVSLFSQEKINWDILADVTYEYEYVETLNIWHGTPDFGDKVQAYADKEISIKGYVIPLQISGDLYMLSALPYQSCFFCGGAGQETVMELRMKSDKWRLKTDELLTFTGILRLNDKELEMSYILENAKPLFNK